MPQWNNTGLPKKNNDKESTRQKRIRLDKQNNKNNKHKRLNGKRKTKWKIQTFYEKIPFFGTGISMSVITLDSSIMEPNTLEQGRSVILISG